MANDDFWASIANAHRVSVDTGREALGWEDDPLSSDLDDESGEDDAYTDGVLTATFTPATGVHKYLRACKERNVVPAQQFMAMLESDFVTLKHRGVGALGGVLADLWSFRAADAAAGRVVWTQLTAGASRTPPEP